MTEEERLRTLKEGSVVPVNLKMTKLLAEEVIRLRPMAILSSDEGTSFYYRDLCSSQQARISELSARLVECRKWVKEAYGEGFEDASDMDPSAAWPISDACKRLEEECSE